MSSQQEVIHDKLVIESHTSGYMGSQVFEVRHYQKEKLPEPFLARLFEQSPSYTCQKSTSHKSGSTILLQSHYQQKDERS